MRCFSLPNKNSHSWWPRSRETIFQINISKFWSCIFIRHKISTFFNANTKIDTSFKTCYIITCFSFILIGNYVIFFGIFWWFRAYTRIKTGGCTHYQPIPKLCRYLHWPIPIHTMLPGNDTFTFLIVFKKDPIKQTLSVFSRIINKTQTFLCYHHLYLPL